MNFITNFLDNSLQKSEGICDNYQLKSCNAIDDLLQWINSHQKKGKFVAGYFSYEFSKALDSSLSTKKSNTLASFIAFNKFTPLKEWNVKQQQLEWENNISKQEYTHIIKKILNYIYEGDIYQVNYSFRKKCLISKLDCEQLLTNLVKNQDAKYTALFSDNQSTIISLSPELFLQKETDSIISQPMKGTIKRGRFLEEDLEHKKTLQNDLKSQAENIMIVDLMRNDFSKICKLHSIKVKNKFEVQTFRTLHQMVTTVSGRLKPNISLYDILKATFPAGSITGAPKNRAMQIINELEKTPRNIYTGSVALFLPNEDFVMNVAIRTLLYKDKNLELGLGSGIVEASNPEKEWEECLLKGNFLKRSFEYEYLFETILYQNDDYINLTAHLERLQKSALYFGQSFCEEIIKKKLNRYKEKLNSTSRVRLYLYKNNSLHIEHIPTTASWEKETIKIKISSKKANSQNIFLFHKTNERSFYTEEFNLACKQGFDEVIFFNEKNFLTEGSISNLFIQEKNGQWLTPLVQNGLLAGTKRQKLILDLKAKETNITKQQLLNAKEILICNSIRQTVKATVS